MAGLTGGSVRVAYVACEFSVALGGGIPLSERAGYERPRLQTGGVCKQAGRRAGNVSDRRRCRWRGLPRSFQ